MKSKKRLIPLALLGLFVVAQSLAIGARLASTPNALFVLFQALAVLAALGAIGVVMLSLSNRHYLARFDEIVANEGDPVWLVSRVAATSDRLSDYLGGRADLSLLFAIAISGDGLRVLRLPSGERIGLIDLIDIEDVRVDRVVYFGGASDCLVVVVRRGGQTIELPLVLARAGTSGYLTQNREQLTASVLLLKRHTRT